MINKWFIGEDKCYYYGDDEESVREEFELDSDFKFISKEDWSAQDYAEIFGSELEDRNRHSLTSMPSSLLYILDKTSISEDEKKMVMKEFMIDILNEF